MEYNRFIALGDSMTEGMSDEVIGGKYRGWGRGLSRLVRENCDLLIKIPMSNTVESLNASVAMSIALYAVDRKRHAI